MVLVISSVILMVVIPTSFSRKQGSLNKLVYLLSQLPYSENRTVCVDFDRNEVKVFGNIVKLSDSIRYFLFPKSIFSALNAKRVCKVEKSPDVLFIILSGEKLVTVFTVSGQVFVSKINAQDEEFLKSCVKEGRITKWFSSHSYLYSS